MRPMPFGCCARAETLRPTPAGMLSPFAGATIVTFGPATMLMRTRGRVGAARRVGRDDDDDEAVERRVGRADRLEVAAHRRVAQPGAERARGGNGDGLVARRLPGTCRDRRCPSRVTPPIVAFFSALVVVQTGPCTSTESPTLIKRADERRIDDDRRLVGVAAPSDERRSPSCPADRDGRRRRQARVAARDEHDSRRQPRLDE